MDEKKKSYYRNSDMYQKYLKRKNKLKVITYSKGKNKIVKKESDKIAKN